MTPNCGPKFEKVLVCMEEKHSASSCREVVQEFLRCQREFVRVSSKETKKRAADSISDVEVGPGSMGKKDLSAPQVVTRREIVVPVNLTFVNNFTKSMSKQVTSMKNTWNTLHDPQMRQNYIRFCKRLGRKISSVVDKAFTEAISWSSNGRNRS